MLELEDCPQTGGAGWSPLSKQEAYDRVYAEAMEFHRPRIKDLIKGALAGRVMCVAGYLHGKLERMDAGDLWEAITEDVPASELAKYLAGCIDQDARGEMNAEAEGWIDAYVEKTAGLMAAEEARKEL